MNDVPRPEISPDRRFYAMTKAFGRLGMRIFEPEVMESAHWHGHVEINLISRASMIYNMDGDTLHVPPDRLVIFWAGVPHQLTRVAPIADSTPQLANIYLPLDVFLFMPHIAELQVTLMGGAMVMLPHTPGEQARIEQWYQDYRSNDFERAEVLKMELNALMRRAQALGLEHLRYPSAPLSDTRALNNARMRHVIDMLRYILENLERPMTNADVAGVTGLHENYALSLFSNTMRVSIKRFIVRMRLIRARALLIESADAVSTVAAASGFTSISQFYDQFKKAYGLSPHALRVRYTQMALR